MSHSVTLTWVASSDSVDGYNVYRAAVAGAEAAPKINAALITALTFTDSAPLLGHNFYEVRSSISGVESVVSNEASTVILPAPPTNLQVTASV